MTRSFTIHAFTIHAKAFLLSNLILTACIGWPLTVLAAPVSAPVSLATSPLTNSTTNMVLPNLMFILDNSGSMGQDYTPDYISDIWSSPATTDKQCRDSGDDDSGTVYSGPANGGTRVLDLCVVGDVPYMNSDMNSQYYNPAISYTPAANANGSSKPSQTDPANVLTDAYNKQNTTQLRTSATSVNITTQYPDRVWCTTQAPSAADLINPAVCRKNSDYLYPNATYKYGRTSGSPDQQVTSTMLGNVIKVSGAPYYYSVVPTEYCTAADLKTCTLTSVPTGVYTFPARSRWCNSSALTTCQSIKAGAYVWPRYVGASNPGTAAVGSFTVTGVSSGTTSVTSIKVNGVEIMGGSGAGCGTASSTSSGSGSTRRNAFANAIVTKINACISSPEYTAVSNGASTPIITITSTIAAGASGNGPLSITGITNGGTVGSIVNPTGGTNSSSIPPYTFTRTDIVSTTASYAKAPGRTDCTGASCSYTEEITNFGNWYAYYRTRMQAMKSAASLAFKPIDNRYRIGFVTISSMSSNYLPIAKFDAGAGSQKENWYNKLFGITPSSSTPLRSALTTVGRIYAGKKPVGSSDPVEYSCQQNFALLTTDGYWNTDTDSDVKDVSGSAVGNKDGGSTPRPMYEGPTASSNSLADAAKYYYDTDLRDSSLGNCTGALGAGVDVCENNVFVSGTDNNVKQHMTTFTLGLGVDGTLLYQSDYKTATSGDYYNLKKGLGSPTVNWPVPTEGNETTVDDLWHAAVNGQGTYFGAKDPAELTQGLVDALSQINSKVGSGAAAATSTLNPVAGDNFAYVASYTTGKWTGNLEARTINTTSGVVSESATWCAEDVVTAACPAPSAIVAESAGSTTSYYCVTPSAASCDAPGVWDGTSCKVEVPKACTGTMAAKVAASSDTRTIFRNKAGLLVPFTHANLTPVEQAYFSSSAQAALNQYSDLTTAQKSKLTGENLVNYLRGQNGFEQNRSANSPDNKVYRYREAVLGDAIESQPAYIGKPTFSYTDAGYSTFKSTNVSRAGTVYIGTNDGMLHAFDAVTGAERWAYVPSMVIPNMWQLADKNYATNHAYFANGSPIISDIYTGGAWKTILVAGLNGGGRGYYALDITNPSAPTLLWEFTPADDADLGFTFGKPVITKKDDGTWVVLVTSGYNNIPDASPRVKYPLIGTGDGKGYLYVLDANTGTKISKISTGVGSVSVPSGLAQIASWADEPEKNNTATFTYGGDLLGNVWRFDINAGTVMKFAELRDTSGITQPITTRPELGNVLTSDGKTHRVVFIGTGKYLEVADLTDTQQQTLYAIRDDDTLSGTPSATLVNPRSFTSGPNRMVQQVISTAGASRTSSNNTIDFKNDRGWYVNFPDSGERQNVASQLVLGTLLVPTTVPSNTVCSPGGTSWLNYFNYRTGGAVDTATNQVSSKANAPIVGVNVIYIPDPVTGKPKPVVSVVTADHPTPEIVPGVGFSSSGAGFQKKRVIWRELVKP